MTPQQRGDGGRHEEHTSHITSQAGNAEQDINQQNRGMVLQQKRQKEIVLRVNVCRSFANYPQFWRK